MKKKILSSLLAITMISCLVVPSFAEEKDTTTRLYTTGTQESAKEALEDAGNPLETEALDTSFDEMEEITISSADDLMELAEKCRLNTWSLNKKVVLTNDISLLGKNFNGIPTFGGVFDGQGHTISEINIKRGLSYAGFFVHLQKTAVVGNLKLTGTVMPEGNTTIVGGVAGDNHGTISNCSFKGVISGNDYIGGIVGINELSGDITECLNEGFVSGKHFTGGIAGKNDGNIAYCKNKAEINTTNSDTEITIDSMEKLNSVLNLLKDGVDQSREEAKSDVTVSDTGGIAGISIGIISYCINDGDIGYAHVGYNVGGIAGRQSGYILKCSNNGVILGRKDIGGIVGQAEPYITVDLSSDVAYQLQIAVSKLHDSVSVTLRDAKNQSNVISNRLAIIQKFTAGAVEDTRFIASGAVDFANGVSGATSEAFSRVNYILEETTKENGVIAEANSAMGNVKSTAEDIKKLASDIDLNAYIKSDDEKKQYNDAKLILESASSQYYNLGVTAERTYYNLYIVQHKGDRAGTSDLQFVDSAGNVITDFSGWSTSDINTNLRSNAQGSWKHASGTAFPDANSSDDRALASEAATQASKDSVNYAIANYINPVTGSKGTYAQDVYTQTTVLLAIYERHREELSKNVRSDTQSAMNNLEGAANNIQSAGNKAKEAIGNVASRGSITFPQFSSEFKARTTSLADNMQGMNDNFGLLNTEVNNANGIMIDDLSSINDQFKNILDLYTDAIDGVLEKDYTNLFTDESLEAARDTTDATIDSCSNFGECSGDIDVSGIAGTMAIEYDYDKESDVTGNTNSNPLTSYLTKCVLRNNNNYSDVTALKDYAGGVCGLQEMGTIIGCGNYSKVESTSGEYVGGVAGSSLSYLVECYARCELNGGKYLGGIAGDGMNIENCFSLVSLLSDTDWSGAIAGHIAEKGEVKNNYFVGEGVAGIDRVSYEGKAEPISYAEAMEARKGNDKGDMNDTDSPGLSAVPYEFENMHVTFVLEDEDLDGGKDKIEIFRRKYGDSLKLDEYPKVSPKDGYYIVWDKDGIDKITEDVTITATYEKYKTTLAEKSESDTLHQSEVLVDGNFKTGDALTVDKEVFYFIDDINNIKNANEDRDYELIHVVVPDDGSSEHTLRFKPQNTIYAAYESRYLVYLVDGDAETLLPATGSLGNYNTYVVPGNEFTLRIELPKIIGSIAINIAIIAAILLLVILLIVVIVIIIKRNGHRLYSSISKTVAEKIESKEALFYDDSNEKKKKVEETEETNKAGTDETDDMQKDADSDKSSSNEEMNTKKDSNKAD